MHDWIQSLKPAASARIHLLLAALMWTVVGAGLLYFGIRWTLASQTSQGYLLVAVAVIIGLLKSKFALDRTAKLAVERIKARGDGRCIGGFLSIRSWVFVVLMMSCGRFLRSGLLPRSVVGFLYTAVGPALLLSSRSFWRAWKRNPKKSPT